MPMPSKIVLPDLLSICPLKGSTSPHYEAAAAESRAWVNGFDMFHGEKLTFFLTGSNELLVSHTYPYAEYEQFRTACDFVNLLFVVDEVSDDQNGKGARQTGMVYLNVMRDPTWDDGSKLARMTREFRARFMRTAGFNCRKRFLEHCEDYIEAISKEAEYRERDEVLDMERYETLRRENSAVRLCFMLAMYALDIDLPDEVFEDSAFMTIYFAACDLVCWANDLYSYNMEQSKGHRGNNILTVLMEAKGISLQQAANIVGEHSGKLMKDLNEAKKRLPSWGVRIDADVGRYISALEDWVIGNLEWSFKTVRYFGPTHDEVKKTRVVALRSRRS